MLKQTSTCQDIAIVIAGAVLSVMHKQMIHAPSPPLKSKNKTCLVDGQVRLLGNALRCPQNGAANYRIFFIYRYTIGWGYPLCVNGGTLYAWITYHLDHKFNKYNALSWGTFYAWITDSIHCLLWISFYAVR